MARVLTLANNRCNKNKHCEENNLICQNRTIGINKFIHMRVDVDHQQIVIACELATVASQSLQSILSNSMIISGRCQNSSLNLFDFENWQKVQKMS